LLTFNAGTGDFNARHITRRFWSYYFARKILLQK